MVLFIMIRVTLEAGAFNLTSNAQFRFQCDASGNNDLIFIDLVTILGNCSDGSRRYRSAIYTN